MISALHFLLKFYEKIYFLCKNKYHVNVSLFFQITSNIVCIPFNENDEINEINNIIQKIYYDTNTDVFVCGDIHKQYLHSKINNKLFLEYNIPDKKDTIDFDTIISSDYNFIENFYKDIGLNLTIYYNYFYIPSSQESIELFNSIKHYNILFIQLSSSCGTKLNISNLLNKYLYDEQYILVCNDKNLYDFDFNVNSINTKKNYAKIL
jgi:hypothetical protein